MHHTLSMRSKIQPLRCGRILVAEDNPVLAIDMVGLLRQAGADVLGPASTAGKAATLAKIERPCCGVLDVNLRDGSIFQAARTLKQQGAGIVFYTASADPDGLQREWPEAYVLFKPAPHTLILNTVAAACRGARALKLGNPTYRNMEPLRKLY